MTNTNKHRADRTARALATYQSDDMLSGCLIDVLADARHWCDRHGYDFCGLDRHAYEHYLCELENQDGGEQ